MISFEKIGVLQTFLNKNHLEYFQRKYTKNSCKFFSLHLKIFVKTYLRWFCEKALCLLPSCLEGWESTLGVFFQGTLAEREASVPLTS
jgi:hypothetical protein